MPSMKECAKMTDNKVFMMLSRIPSSDYYGLNPAEIAMRTGLNEALRHLNDLILLNDRNKSKLFMVIEKSVENQSVRA